MRFIIDMYSTFTDDGVFGWVMAVLLTILILAFIGMVGYGIFYIFDSSFLPEMTAPAQIVDKDHHAAYTTFIHSGKVLIPQYHPERWTIIIELNGLADDVSVDRYYWESLQLPKPTEITYSIGRHSKDLYIKSYLP